RRGEHLDEAVHRRLEQELGCAAELEFVYKFRYQASFGAAGSEHELCSVFVGRMTRPVQANRNEVADWKFMAPEAVDALVADDTANVTPWFRMEWRRLRGEYAERIAALTEPMQA
ncbi:MAG: NUDIX domain-containing protein, partial [Pseudomonadota bacterium]